MKKGIALLFMAVASALMLTGCNEFKIQRMDSSVTTHNVCYELRQQLAQNESANVPNEQGQSPVERARLLQEFKKYHCAERQLIRR